MSSKTNNNNRPKSAQGSNNSKDKSAPTAAAAAPPPPTTTTTTSNAWSKPNNAWSRPLKTGPPPGLSAPSSGGNGALDPVMRERFLHLTLTLVGQRVTCTQQDGTVLEGVFHTATPFQDLPADKKNVYVLKAVLVVKGDKDKIPDGSTVVIPANKITSLHCKSLRLGAVANGKGESFRTDTEISLTPNDDRRDLVAAGSAWTAAGNSRADALMEGGPTAAPAPRKVGLRGTIGEWDQFRANEELFNVQAKFDENLYTTELDKSAMDSSKIKQAELMAREIENTTSGNIHVAEERNQAVGGDYDEEDRYSGVLTEKLQARNKDGAPAPKKMNYAAAAAKADAAKLAPPGFVADKKEDKVKDEKKGDVKENKTKSANGTDETKREAVSNDAPNQSSEDAGTQEEKKTTEAEDSKPGEKESVVKKEEGKNGESDGKAETEDATTKEETQKAPAKLNANAKSFSFNPGAKTFTPSFGTSAAPADPQQMVDPNTGVPVPQQIPGQPHYMQHHMGQPGMMPIMNPHFAMQYPRGYPGMEQQPVQPQHMQQHPHMHQQPHEGAAAPAGGNEQQQTGESANQAPHQPQQQQPPPQHPGVPVPYPPNAPQYHYPGAMPMHQRGPGGPHMAYPPQMVGQQIPVVPGRNPYQHMYGMPPPPPMRGPNGAPYYPNAAPHYPQYIVGEDDYRGGGRGRGGGRRGGRGGRKGGRGGRGGYGYQHNPRDQGVHNGGGGRHAPHSNAPSAEQSPAAEAAPSAAKKEEPSSAE